MHIKIIFFPTMHSIVFAISKCTSAVRRIFFHFVHIPLSASYNRFVFDSGLVGDEAVHLVLLGRSFFSLCLGHQDWCHCHPTTALQGDCSTLSLTLLPLSLSSSLRKDWHTLTMPLGLGYTWMSEAFSEAPGYFLGGKVAHWPQLK